MTPFSDSSVPRLLKYITEPFENNTGRRDMRAGRLVQKNYRSLKPYYGIIPLIENPLRYIKS
jgi:hypothetical protein